VPAVPETEGQAEEARDEEMTTLWIVLACAVGTTAFAFALALCRMAASADERIRRMTGGGE